MGRIAYRLWEPIPGLIIVRDSGRLTVYYGRRGIRLHNKGESGRNDYGLKENMGL